MIGSCPSGNMIIVLLLSVFLYCVGPVSAAAFYGDFHFIYFYWSRGFSLKNTLLCFFLSFSSKFRGFTGQKLTIVFSSKLLCILSPLDHKLCIL